MGPLFPRPPPHCGVSGVSSYATVCVRCMVCRVLNRGTGLRQMAESVIATQNVKIVRDMNIQTDHGIE